MNLVYLATFVILLDDRKYPTSKDGSCPMCCPLGKNYTCTHTPQTNLKIRTRKRRRNIKTWIFQAE